MMHEMHGKGSMKMMDEYEGKAKPEAKGKKAMALKNLAKARAARKSKAGYKAKAIM